jgi:hypothetical protein
LIGNELILCESLLVFEFNALEGDNLLTLWHEVVLEVHLLQFSDSKPKIYIVCINCTVQFLQVNAAFTVAAVCNNTKSVVFGFLFIAIILDFMVRER